MNRELCLLDNKSRIKPGLIPDGFNEKKYSPYVKSLYNQYIVKELMQELNYSNRLMVPYLSKVVISSSISTLKYGGDKQILAKIFNAIAMFTGVTPIFTKSSVSIAKFKLIAGTITGCKTILRGNNMYEFIEKLVEIYLPNVKGFLGIKESSVNNSNLSIGFNDMSIIPEVNHYLGLTQIGFTVTICCKNVQNSTETIQLLKKFDIPIKKEL